VKSTTKQHQMTVENLALEASKASALELIWLLRA
jgi:hypothetical protein